MRPASVRSLWACGGSFQGRHRNVLDATHRQLEEAPPELAERLGVAGREEAVLAHAVALVLLALPLERLGDLARRLLRGKDERHVAAEDTLEDLAEERIVGAAEDHGVDAGLLERCGVLAHGGFGLLAVRVVTLDERHEPGARNRVE